MKKKSGFTITELMIVVSIIAFLASLAIPTYFKYLARAKQAEVAINLASLHTAEQMYFAEHGKYSDNLEALGWKPGNNFFYTYGFDASNKKHFIGKLKTSADHLKNKINEKGFIAYAAGDILGKGNVDIWTIDEDRNITHLQNGLI